MTYSVNWTLDARSQLAHIWISRAALRGAITAAQASIDRLLASNPSGHAVSASEDLFAIIVHPLKAQYEISDDDGNVTVVSVRLAP